LFLWKLTLENLETKGKRPPYRFFFDFVDKCI